MNKELKNEIEERGYVTLGDIRKLDYPDETPVFTNSEGGCYLATVVGEAYINQEEFDDNLELDPEDEKSDDKPILALYFG